jgi:hypothetical protein
MQSAWSTKDDGAYQRLQEAAHQRHVDTMLRRQGRRYWIVVAVLLATSLLLGVWVTVLASRLSELERAASEGTRGGSEVGLGASEVAQGAGEVREGAVETTPGGGLPEAVVGQAPPPAVPETPAAAVPAAPLPRERRAPPVADARPAAPADVRDRMARWLVDTHGGDEAERRVEQVLSFYPPDSERAEHWRAVLAAIRAAGRDRGADVTGGRRGD